MVQVAKDRTASSHVLFPNTQKINLNNMNENM